MASLCSLLYTLLVPNSRLIMVHSEPIIFRSACTGRAQPLVARVRAPVCPSLAVTLWLISNPNWHSLFSICQLPGERLKGVACNPTLHTEDKGLICTIAIGAGTGPAGLAMVEPFSAEVDAFEFFCGLVPRLNSRSGVVKSGRART